MTNIEIEFYEKSNNVLLILTGIGGTTKSFQNKYETIAHNVMKTYGFSVMVATTPSGSWLRLNGNNLQDIMNLIIEKKHNKNFDVYVMGSSAGANIILNYSYSFPQIKRVLAINPVLIMNLHKIHQGIKNFNGEKITVIFGENDYSCKLLEVLPQSNILDTIILPKVDHTFKGQLETFIDLPNHYLFYDKWTLYIANAYFIFKCE